MRLEVWWFLLCVAPALACAQAASSRLPEPVVGSKYTLIDGELPFYDSGCSQERKPDGKLVSGTWFVLVEERDGCWLVTLPDEVDTYVRPNGDTIRSKR